HGDSRELFLVVIPKNILVALTVILLIVGVPWSSTFFFGWILFLIGIILRLLALRQLGPMYSLNVDIREHHRLVTSGAYSLVRHPLYLAYILDTLGILLFLQRWYLYLFIVPIIVGWLVRIPDEERDLLATFGKKYSDYAARV